MVYTYNKIRSKYLSLESMMCTSLNRQLEFWSAPGVAYEILEKEPKSCLLVFYNLCPVTWKPDGQTITWFLYRLPTVDRLTTTKQQIYTANDIYSIIRNATLSIIFYHLVLIFASTSSLFFLPFFVPVPRTPEFIPEIKDRIKKLVKLSVIELFGKDCEIFCNDRYQKKLFPDILSFWLF